MIKGYLVALTLISMAVLTGCGGGGGEPGSGAGETAKVYKVTATAGGRGSITPPNRSVQSGQTTTFTVNPDIGYSIASVSGCNGSLSGNIYTTGTITAACSVIASFTQQQAQVVVSVSPELAAHLSDENEYNLVSRLGGLSYSDGISSELFMVNDPSESELVFLVNDINEPIAIGLRYPGEDSVVVSVEDSAIVFVLRNERFFGVDFEDLASLTQRIKAHSQFDTLVSNIQNEIANDSPCPMNPLCSFHASLIAEEIAAELDLTDLVAASEGGN